MTLFAQQQTLTSLVERLGPYARRTLERAAEHAIFLHAEAVAPEHLLTILLQDEEAGATRLVLFAFADPETLAIEVLALSPGIMVVGSKRTMPFSVLGVRALEGALSEARRQGEETVEPEHVLQSAWRWLAKEQRAALEEAGARVTFHPPTDEQVDLDAPLLRFFSNDARRAMGAACRTAQKCRRDAISPAHVIGGALETDADLRERIGLSMVAFTSALIDRDADETPPEVRTIEADERLTGLLRDLPDGADTLAILGWFLTDGTPELRELLRRQKITSELYSRAGEAFGDPD